MATIKAFIRTSNKGKPFVNVRFRLTDGRDIQLFHSSDIKVNPNDFDVTNQKIKAKVLCLPEVRAAFDNCIIERKMLIEKIYLNANDKTALTSTWLEVEIDKYLNPSKYIVVDEQRTKYLLSHVGLFIENAPLRRKKMDNLLLSKGTIDGYNANYKRLKEFATYKRKSDFLLADVDDRFVDEYIDFLTNNKKYTNNTIGEAFKCLKNFLSNNHNHNINFKNYSVLRESIDNVYLTESELQSIKDLDLSNALHFDKARDMFLCLAWTCSRISDVKKIANVKDGKIYYHQQKTKAQVIIPLHPIVKEILTKYDDAMPRLGAKKLNEYIKEVCRLAGIDETTTFTRTVGGRIATTTQHKYERVSSHTGRRSFCTNMYLRGLDTLMIMSISGHKTEKSFLTYIKVTAEEHADRMAKIWNEIYK